MLIFLDVDGVLNKKSDWKIPYTLNPVCMEQFCRFAGKLKSPQIVLSSSWRSGWDKDYNQCTPQIQMLIMELRKNNIPIIGVTKKSPDKDRGKEILYYLKWNNPDNEDYVVIDDDKNEYKTPIPSGHLILTDCGYGFVEKKKR